MNVVSSLSTIPIRVGDERIFLHVEVCNTSDFLTPGKPLAFFHCAVILKDHSVNPIFGSSAKDFSLKEGDMIEGNDYLKGYAESLKFHILNEIIKNFRPINRQFQMFRYFVNIHFAKDVLLIDPKLTNRTSSFFSEVTLDPLDDHYYSVHITRTVDKAEEGAYEFVRLGFPPSKTFEENTTIEFKELLPIHFSADKRQTLCEHITAEIISNYSHVDPKFHMRQYFAKIRVNYTRKT